MFKPKRSGYTTVDGQIVRYIAGEVCYHDLSHISHAERVVQKQHTAVVETSETRTIHPSQSKPLEGTAKEIRDWLDENGIEYKARANKSELLDLLKRA